jgi:putative two-component system response regulator
VDPNSVDDAIDPAASPAVLDLLRRAADAQQDAPDQARQHALGARIVARAEGDRVGEAEALYRLANLAHAGGRPEDAFGLALEASEVAEACGAQLVEAWSLHLLGIVHYQASNFSEALSHCERALDVYQATGRGLDDSNMLNTVAAIYHSMGDNDRAIATYEEALAAAEPFGRPDMVALILGNIARIRSSRSEYLSAVSTGRRAIELARVHSPAIVTSLLADLAESYIGLADPDRAAQCFAEARRLHAESSERGNEPTPSAQLALMVAEGRVALRRGSLGEAIVVLQAALDMAERSGAREYELEINDLLATAFKRSGRFEEALDRREAHDRQHRQLVTHASDLRLRTLEVAHRTTEARLRSEVYRLRTDRTDPVTPSPPADDDPTVDTAFDIVSDTLSDTLFDDTVFDAAVDAVPGYLEAFQQLAILTEFRDAVTGEHTHRVGDLAAEIAHAMGRPPEWCEQLRLAARLHDIGKVAVPDAVLGKTGALTVEEYEMMKAHTSMGHRILAGNSAPMFQMAAEIAQSHHEWWDGSGYPLGISGPSIALSGRIVTIADVFDALCSKRPYKRAWPIDESARFVVSGRGGQFDPDVVEAFVAVLVARHPDLADDLR